MEIALNKPGKSRTQRRVTKAESVGRVVRDRSGDRF